MGVVPCATVVPCAIVVPCAMVVPSTILVPCAMVVPCAMAVAGAEQASLQAHPSYIHRTLYILSHPPTPFAVSHEAAHRKQRRVPSGPPHGARQRHCFRVPVWSGITRCV